MARVQLENEDEGGAYFSNPKPNLEFITSGCRVLDLALGGGWPMGRISNVVGDNSTGKTLLAIEASCNFARKFKKGDIYFREAESAFDKPYASALGMPMSRVKFLEPQLHTVEDFHDDLNDVCKQCRQYKKPGFYVLDSLDALSDEAEVKREITDGSYGAQKAKKMSELFRKLVRDVEASNVHLMIISQLRDKIGAMFGEKSSRSGGRALNFYASQVVWLHHMGAITKTTRGQKLPVGVEIKAKVKKNKIGLPLREAHFDILFGFGTDDLRASLMFLNEIDAIEDVGGAWPKGAKDRMTKILDMLDDLNDLPDGKYWEEVDRVGALVERRWREMDKAVLPTRNKRSRPS